ncbi:hypothetical protein [Kribbella caucasensis]|uniref:hypothetical protein n=1 Tax=Kribbella caucasensis TaxID=2512215 RepID=UPI00105EDD24|nr:hypothetical protein [Kribbella sp. VKM Ac-2527]
MPTTLSTHQAPATPVHNHVVPKVAGRHQHPTLSTHQAPATPVDNHVVPKVAGHATNTPP